MRTFNLWDTLTLVHLITLSLAIPALTSPFTPRSQAVCANYPNTIAGTQTPSSPAPRSHNLHTPKTRAGRDQPVLWCAPSSATSILVTMASAISGASVEALLSSCYDAILQHISALGDGLVPSGVFSWPPGVNNLALHVWDTNNHQVTWGVLGAALSALENFMGDSDEWGGATFLIYDGGVEVATGVLGLSG